MNDNLGNLRLGGMAMGGVISECTADSFCDVQLPKVGSAQ
jgi:hypothetical protein